MNPSPTPSPGPRRLANPALHDRGDSFGWISIALHWVTALLLILMWIMGKGIDLAPPELVDGRRSAHVTLGLVIWLLLAGRILWRLRSGHPRAAGQTDRTHRLAVMAHYLMLGLLSLMLLSGPLLAWALPDQVTLARIAHTLHGLCANGLALLVVIHVGAALKHLMFHDDETIARIFVPRRSNAGTTGPHAEAGAPGGNISQP